MNRGLQYEKKSFTNMPEGDIALHNVMDEKESARLKEESLDIAVKVKSELSADKKQKTKKIIPWGDKLLVSRRKQGQVSKHIVLADHVADRPTDVADVVYVPDHSFCDKTLIEKSEGIINGLAKKAEEGDSQAVISLLRLREYLMIKSIRPGDVLLVGKYVGTDFNVKETGESLTVMDSEGIYAKIVDKE